MVTALGQRSCLPVPSRRTGKVTEMLCSVRDPVIRRMMMRYATQQAIHSEQPMGVDDLEALENALMSNASPKPKEEEMSEPYVTYTTLMRIAPDLPPSVRNVIKMIVEQRDVFEAHPHERIYIFRILMIGRWYERKCFQRELVVSHALDVESMRLEDFEQYVHVDIIPRLGDRLSSDGLRTCYTVLLNVGVFFPLDKSRKGIVSIKELLSSSLLDQIDEATAETAQADDQIDPVITNWFSLTVLHMLHDEYRQCNTMRTGMLTYIELLDMYEGSLNPEFLRGVFNTQPTFKSAPDEKGHTVNQLDFHGFVTLYRAIYQMAFAKRPIPSHPDYRIGYQEAQSIRYVFSCLDYSATGFLSRQFIMRLLTRNVVVSNEDIVVEDLVDQVFDLANPKEPERGITLDDLMTCTRAYQVLGLLIDARQISYFERRAEES